MSTVDSFAAKQDLSVGGTDYEIYALDAVEGAEKLPYSLKILLENLLRTEDAIRLSTTEQDSAYEAEAAAVPGSGAADETSSPARP